MVRTRRIRRVEAIGTELGGRCGEDTDRQTELGISRTKAGPATRVLDGLTCLGASILIAIVHQGLFYSILFFSLYETKTLFPLTVVVFSKP